VQASGLIALKKKSPQVKDIQIDLEAAKIINADTKIEDVPIKTVVIGEGYIERPKKEKPQTFVCIIGEKGKVLLTLFSQWTGSHAGPVPGNDASVRKPNGASPLTGVPLQSSACRSSRTAPPTVAI
jgi:hypothetical protein